MEPVAEPLEGLLRRWARTHVPFLAADAATRWGLPVSEVEQALRRLAARGDLVAGAFRHRAGAGEPAEREYCHPDVLRTLRRRSLAALRREAEPVPAEILARFLPAWHGIGSQADGTGRLLDCVVALQGLALPASVIERDVLGMRVAGYRPSLLDELIAMGDVVWIGRGSLGPGDGRVALYLRSDAAKLAPEPGDLVQSQLSQKLRAHLEHRGASFFRDLYVAAGGGDQDVVLDALWDMVWAGEVTNDTFAPLRLLGTQSRKAAPTRRAPIVRLSQPRASGRWSLVRDLLEPSASPTERAYAQAGTLLQRHGVLTRESVVAEGWAGGFTGLYPVLRAMEEVGRIRRGYFVDGLGGSQFALPGAVDRLRAAREVEGPLVALAATDPANPYGAALPWPPGAEGRMARAAGAFVVLDSGELRLYLERGGRSLLTHGEVRTEHIRALAAAAGRAGRIEVQKVDGTPVRQSPLARLLLEAGFGQSPRGLTLWPRPAA